MYSKLRVTSLRYTLEYLIQDYTKFMERLHNKTSK